MNRTLVMFAPTLFLVHVLSHAAFGQAGREGHEVAQVLAAWSARRGAVKTVRYKVEGTEIIPKGAMTREPREDLHPSLTRTFPPADMENPRAEEYLLDFSKGRIRRELHNRQLRAETGTFRSRVVVQYVDGKRGAAYQPRAANTSPGYAPSEAQHEVTVYENDPPGLLLTDDGAPILHAHGLVPLYCKESSVRDIVSERLDPAYFRFHERGTIEGATCVVLRSLREGSGLGMFDEFWVDLARGGAILRWCGYGKHGLWRQLDVRYQQVGSLWLPSSWRCSRYTRGAAGMSHVRLDQMQVTEIQVDPQVKDESFRPPLKHGMIVRAPPKGAAYVVASDDATLVPMGQSTQVWRWWHYLMVCLFIGAVGLCAGYLFRSRRGVKKPTPPDPNRGGL